LPASQKVRYQIFEVSARPSWWFRRWMRFPLYFQATHPSFEFIVKKISEPQKNAGNQPIPNLHFYIEFSDGATVDFSTDVSSMKVGDTLRHKTQRILLAPTGDARICLDMGQNMITGQHHFHTLYAFVISAEATLVFLLLNVILGALIALLLKL
jgi:hypothetical protein